MRSMGVAVAFHAHATDGLHAGAVFGGDKIIVALEDAAFAMSMASMFPQGPLGGEAGAILSWTRIAW